MKKASFTLPNLAIFLLLIGTTVFPMFGEGQMVIEGAIVDEKGCSKVNEFCTPYLGIVCCEGLTCNVPQGRPGGFCEPQYS